ncbi:MAG TPA: Rieske 2Fe-2S domain-containing protein, partial [Chloroflexota bacterium]
CAHRGTTLAVGWVEEDCVRCFYHGWKYDATGQCVEMPAEAESFASKIRIAAYPIEEFAGVVFAYMGEGQPPELPRLPELRRGYGVQWAFKMVWPCNWFQRVENAFDPWHALFTHRRGSPTHTTFLGSGEGITFETEETDWGLRFTAVRGTDNTRITEYLWPNASHIMTSGPDPTQPWLDDVFWTVPVDDEHTLRINVFSAPYDGKAAEHLRGVAETQHAYDPSAHHAELFRKQFPDSISIIQAQDYVAQVAQGAIADRSTEHLGTSDRGIMALRRVFRREVDAVKAARPGKPWQPQTHFARLPVPPGVPPAPDR